MIYIQKIRPPRNGPFLHVFAKKRLRRKSEPPTGNSVSDPAIVRLAQVQTVNFFKV